MKRLGIVATVWALLVAGASAQCVGQRIRRLKNEYARGITVEGTKAIQKPNSAGAGKIGVQYAIFTETSGYVSSAHRFHSGDRFRIAVRVNEAAYVYILNRTIVGSTFARGIVAVAINKANPYRLLYPEGSQAGNNHLGVDQKVLLPEGGYFKMDQQPGEEKVILVVTRTPIDIAKYYHIESGEPLIVNQTDSEAHEEAQFSGALIAWNKNTEFAEAPDISIGRGIKIDRVESVGVARVPGKPIAVVVDLIHLPD